MLPTFLVIGAKKAGTSSLFHHLRAHPDVFVPDSKRVDFFSGVNWDRGVGWYENQFRIGDGARARGEVCNSYTHDPVVSGVPERAHSVVPDVRLVCIIRHPIERIESHYRQAVAEWGVTAPIDEAIRANPGEFIAPSRYGHQLARWLECYPRDQLLVTTAEELGSDPAPVLSRILDFIGVDATWTPPDVDQRRNQAGDHRLQPRTLRELRTSAIYRSVRHRLPAGVRRAAWLATSRPPKRPIRSTIGPELRSELAHTLERDLALLRDLVPGLPDWDLSTESSGT